MIESLQTVVETPEFLSQAKRLLTDAERNDLISHLAANPKAGDVIQGTSGARKFRWAMSGRGKRGSVRVITFFTGEALPVFLLGIFSKNTNINLSKAERNELWFILKLTAPEYRNRR